jgi:transposase
MWRQHRPAPRPRSRSSWPAIADGVLRLTPVEFAALFDGIDWRRVQASREIPTPVAPA